MSLIFLGVAKRKPWLPPFSMARIRASFSPAAIASRQLTSMEGAGITATT
jgi:hypothetical protein